MTRDNITNQKSGSKGTAAGVFIVLALIRLSSYHRHCPASVCSLQGLSIAALEHSELLFIFVCLCLAALRMKAAGKAPSIYKSVIGKTVLIPASVFGVDVPELWYKGEALAIECKLWQHVLLGFSDFGGG